MHVWDPTQYILLVFLFFFKAKRREGGGGGENEPRGATRRDNRLTATKTKPNQTKSACVKKKPAARGGRGGETTRTKARNS